MTYWQGKWCDTCDYASRRGATSPTPQHRLQGRSGSRVTDLAPPRGHHRPKHQAFGRISRRNPPAATTQRGQTHGPTGEIPGSAIQVPVLKSASAEGPTKDAAARKEKAKSKAAPDFNVSNNWGWICSCGVVNRTPSKTCEACLEGRARSTYELNSAYNVYRHLIYFYERTFYRCVYKHDLNELCGAHVESGWGEGSWTTPLTGPPSTSTTTGDQPPISKAAPPKATTAHFLLTEDRHLLLASGGYVTRRTREFILPREFVDYLDSVHSPFLGPNLGVVPEQDFVVG